MPTRRELNLRAECRIIQCTRIRPCAPHKKEAHWQAGVLVVLPVANGPPTSAKCGWRTLVRRTGFKTRLQPLEGALRGVPRTSSAKKGGDPECMLRGLRGRRLQGPVPSGPARGDPARTQLDWGAFRTARGL